MPIDASIPLAVNPPPQMDLAGVYGNVLKLRAAKQQEQITEQQMHQQNALRQLFAQPDALGESGLPTANTLAKVYRIDPDAGLKLGAQLGQAEERQAQSAHIKSETQAADRKLYAGQVRDGLDTYDAEMASGNVPPTIAERNLRKSLSEEIDGLTIDQKEKDRLRKVAMEAPIAALRTYAISDTVRAEVDKLKTERTPMVMGGKPVLLDKTGDVYDPTTGKKLDVTGPVQKPESLGEEERARQAAKREDDMLRHQREQESIERQRLDLAERAAARSEAAEKPNLDPEAISLMADQYLSGDKSVFQNLGRGKQGAADIAALRTEITRQAKQRGMGGAEIGTKIAEFAGITSGERALGTRTANVGMAVNEAKQFADLSADAYAKLPRSAFVPFNKLEQMVQTNLSSPEQAAAYAADNSFINAYARAVNPSGVPTESDKKHARDMLNTAQGPDAHAATLAQLQKEMAAAIKSPQTVRDEFADSRKPGGAAPKTDSLSPADVKKIKAEHPDAAQVGLAHGDQNWYVKKGGKWFRAEP